MASTARKRLAADPIDDFTEGLSDSFIQCRDFGHQWKPYRAFRLPRNEGFRRVLKCGRCTTERNQDITPRGMILTGFYAYPDGYLAPKGSGAMTGDHRDFLRMTSTLRLVARADVKHTPEDRVIDLRAPRTRANKASARGA